MLKSVKVKYPLYLFIFIFLIKIIYVVIESYYNYHVLTVTTDPSLTREIVESLNTNGHLISAFGITLIIFPFLYFASGIFKNFTKSILSIMTIFVYMIAYESLNIVVDKIVEFNKDKRYDAYYVNILKYGILNNIFTYDSFIKQEKISNNTIDVKDRILLTNSFLLLYLDKDLIKKLKNRGRNKVADLYIDRDAKKDYQEKYLAFKKVSQDISHFWKKFNNSKLQLQQLASSLDEVEIQKAYDVFIMDLKNNYIEYKNLSKKLEIEMTDDKVRHIQNYLNKYFRYQNTKTAKERYREMMNEKFGHYIEPDIWKDKHNKVSKNQIRKVIKSEILKGIDSQLMNIPEGLNVEQFMYHDETRLLVMRHLKNKGIIVPYSFDYSYEEFKKYYRVMASNKYNEAYIAFYDKLKKSGAYDLKLDTTWKAFVYSKFIHKKLKVNLPDLDKNSLENIKYTLYSKDLANFRKLVYLPLISNKVKTMMYKQSDFIDGASAVDIGNDAIKLLYIPPFALSVSMISLLFNLLGIISMLLSAINIKLLKRSLIKSFIILVVIIAPYFSQSNFIGNFLENNNIDQVTKYIYFLRWLSFYEEINFSIYEK
jgi:hypothetical protein